MRRRSDSGRSTLLLSGGVDDGLDESLDGLGADSTVDTRKTLSR